MPLEAPDPSPVLGMYGPPTASTVGAVFEDVASREQYVVESICTVYVTEVREGLYRNV